MSCLFCTLNALGVCFGYKFGIDSTADSCIAKRTVPSLACGPSQWKCLLVGNWSSVFSRMGTLDRLTKARRCLGRVIWKTGGSIALVTEFAFWQGQTNDSNIRCMFLFVSTWLLEQKRLKAVENASRHASGVSWCQNRNLSLWITRFNKLCWSLFSWK